ncbi:hypothetical protein DFH27DRAFT_608535 [Peziza echinospora]|nr:hypothetical protein DFH27DRAFT_608535 [Peziza echinospora]
MSQPQGPTTALASAESLNSRALAMALTIVPPNAIDLTSNEAQTSDEFVDNVAFQSVSAYEYHYQKLLSMGGKEADQEDWLVFISNVIYREGNRAAALCDWYLNLVEQRLEKGQAEAVKKRVLGLETHLRPLAIVYRAQSLSERRKQLHEQKIVAKWGPEWKEMLANQVQAPAEYSEHLVIALIKASNFMSITDLVPRLVVAMRKRNIKAQKQTHFTKSDIDRVNSAFEPVQKIKSDNNQGQITLGSEVEKPAWLSSLQQSKSTSTDSNSKPDENPDAKGKVLRQI